MEQIEKSEIIKRLQRIDDIFSDLGRHADKQAMMRCPYKNRFDQCTAKFHCGNQREPRRKGELLVCVSDDKLDYRSAWETDPDAYRQAQRKIALIVSGRKKKATSTGRVCYGSASQPAVPGKTIFDFADELEIRVPTSCGRTGHCHECIVEIKQGADALSAPSDAEAFLKAPYRLACQAIVENPNRQIEFSLLRRSPKILTTQIEGEDDFDPVVTRRGGQVFYDDEAIDQDRGQIYGISIDIGTTTVAGELVDLSSGKSIYSLSFENPQRFGGSDVMHRISYDAGAYQGELHRSIINSLNNEIRQMCRRLDISRHQIYEIVIVGNATMRDLFFGLDVQSIGQRPYKSLVEHEYLDGKRSTTSLNEAARSLGIRANRNARVFGAPLIASHVGADTTAALLTLDIENHNEVSMLVDVGTNTEVVIGHKDRLIAASCPAGPAFEGGLVTFGMPGCEGAIESIRYVGGPGTGGRFEYETIGNATPRGICGSGLIDLLAELRRNQLMTPKGVFADKAKQFVIVPEQGITFSRSDASELAQAKAANYCGQMILMRKFGVQPQQIDKLYLAGAFANYVNAANAIEIGFLAPAKKERIVKIGNGAAHGARRMLLSGRKRQAIERLVKRIEHVELETMPDFFDAFVEGCQIKPMVIPNSIDHGASN